MSRRRPGWAAACSLGLAACGPLPERGPGDARPAAAGATPAAIVDAPPDAAAPDDLAVLQGAVGALVGRVAEPLGRLGDGLCTAALVAPDVVLTAAHCLRAAPHGERQFCFTLRPALWGTAGRAERPAGCVPVVDVVRPPALGAAQAPDIALGFLAEPLGAPLMPLWPAGPEADALRPGQPVWLAGFGLRTSPLVSAWADDDGVRVWAPSRVAAVHADALVVGAPGLPQRCRGDSGGPTLARGADGRWRVAAVGSRPLPGLRPCVDGGLEVRVDRLAGWIAGHLAPAEADPAGAGD